MQNTFVMRDPTSDHDEEGQSQNRFSSVRPVDDPGAAAHVTNLVAQNRELRAELEQIRAERNCLAETQGKIMDLLKVKSPDKLLHDIRNVLNERELLKALVGDI